VRVLNDHKGDMDGRVALTSEDIRCLVVAVDLLNDQHPALCAGMGGDTLLTQLDAILLDLYTRNNHGN